MTELEALQKAIRELHGYESSHLQSVPVNETYQGRLVWNGTVEVFQVHGHPGAGLAYAWSYMGDDNKRHYVTVLGVPPVNSALDAVRAYVVSQSVKNST